MFLHWEDVCVFKFHISVLEGLCEVTAVLFITRLSRFHNLDMIARAGTSDWLCQDHVTSFFFFFFHATLHPGAVQDTQDDPRRLQRECHWGECGPDLPLQLPG